MVKLRVGPHLSFSKIFCIFHPWILLYYLFINVAEIIIAILFLINLISLWRTRLFTRSWLEELIMVIFTKSCPLLHASRSLPLHSTRASINIWHQRFGHPHESIVCRVISHNNLPSLSLKFYHCTSFILGKESRKHLPLVFSKCHFPLEMIHSDVWGPAPVSSNKDHRYFVFFLDDFF